MVWRTGAAGGAPGRSSSRSRCRFATSGGRVGGCAIGAGGGTASGYPDQRLARGENLSGRLWPQSSPLGRRSSCPLHGAVFFGRSEEHTSELQSLMRISYAVFCLKKTKHKKKTS